jgi:hypothetical protein
MLSSGRIASFAAVTRRALSRLEKSRFCGWAYLLYGWICRCCVSITWLYGRITAVKRLTLPPKNKSLAECVNSSKEKKR